MMDALSKFDEFMNVCVKPLLKSCGFTNKRHSFFLKGNGNTCLINFQKRRKSSANEVIFTVNLGIASARIQKFYSKEVKFPSIADCHWQRRLGFLMSQKSDVWWSVFPDTELSVLCNDLSDILVGLAIPELSKYASDESLRDLWGTGSSPGITNIQRLKNLSILLRLIGTEHRLDTVINELRAVSNKRIISSAVEMHIAKLLKH